MVLHLWGLYVAGGTVLMCGDGVAEWSRRWTWDQVAIGFNPDSGNHILSLLFLPWGVATIIILIILLLHWDPWWRTCLVRGHPSFKTTVSDTFLFTWMGLFRLQQDFRIQIYLSEGSKNGFEMHFECAFSPFRILTFNMVPPLSSCLHVNEPLTKEHPCF